MISLRALPNLSAAQTFPSVPWDFEAPIPDEVRGKDGKTARHDWINNADTEHCCYSGFEGLNENLRITKGGEDGNPAYRMHAVVADFDAKLGMVELELASKRCTHQPAYIERTLSGNARFVWLLETPLTLPCSAFAAHFLSNLVDRLKLDQVAPALDRKAFENPGQYYTNSCDWLMVAPSARLSTALITGWYLEASDRFLWNQYKDLGPTIPLADVEGELRQRYPRFSQWPGAFEEGARGLTFWIDGSVSPGSAIVRPNGIQTFASHATKAFYNWADLLGAKFVEEYRSVRLGKSVEGIFFDTKTYFVKTTAGKWRVYQPGDLRNFLNTARGLNSAKKKGAASEVDSAIDHIQQNNAIDGAAPLVFRPAGVVRLSGCEVLNLHTANCLQPAPGVSQWGPDGKFPWISSLLDGFFVSQDQLEYFIAWASTYYRGCLDRELELGQFIFLGGEAGCGKSLLNREIVGELVGGYVDAVRYIMGEDQFGSQNFAVAHWCVDDASVNTSIRSVGEFSERVKKMAADSLFEHHAKFCVPTSTIWNGRLFTTHNLDTHSTRIIPDMEISIREKISLLQAAKRSFPFPERREIRRILSVELPWFARYLADHKIPEALREPRFGLKSVHDPMLIGLANSSSRSTGFAEILADFTDRYFETGDKAHWQGTSFQLHRDLNGGGADAAMRGITVDAVARMLGLLQAKGHPIESIGDETSELRQWRLLRRDKPTHHTPAPARKAAGKSQFDKQ